MNLADVLIYCRDMTNLFIKIDFINVNFEEIIL